MFVHTARIVEQVVSVARAQASPRMDGQKYAVKVQSSSSLKHYIETFGDDPVGLARRHLQYSAA
jgi:hypothetical protein